MTVPIGTVCSKGENYLLSFCLFVLVVVVIVLFKKKPKKQNRVLRSLSFRRSEAPSLGISKWNFPQRAWLRTAAPERLTSPGDSSDLKALN